MRVSRGSTREPSAQALPSSETIRSSGGPGVEVVLGSALARPVYRLYASSAGQALEGRASQILQPSGQSRNHPAHVEQHPHRQVEGRLLMATVLSSLK